MGWYEEGYFLLSAQIFLYFRIFKHVSMKLEPVFISEYNFATFTWSLLPERFALLYTSKICCIQAGCACFCLKFLPQRFSFLFLKFLVWTLSTFRNIKNFTKNFTECFWIFCVGLMLLKIFMPSFRLFFNFWYDHLVLFLFGWIFFLLWASLVFKMFLKLRQRCVKFSYKIGVLNKRVLHNATKCNIGQFHIILVL